MSGSQRGGGRGRGGFPSSGPIGQRGRGRGGGNFYRDQGHSSEATATTQAVYGDGNFPLPSEHVDSVEKQYLEYYGAKGQDLDKDLRGTMLSHRPNFGSNGTEVVLWANYFHLKFEQSETLYQYDIVIYDPKKIPEDNKNSGRATDPKETSGDKKNDEKATKHKNISEDSKDDGRVTGRKAMDIFKQIFDQVRRDNVSGELATDFKQKIVTLGYLNSLPEHLNYRSRQYKITVSEPQVLRVEEFMSLLDNQTPSASLATTIKLDAFPFHQDTISAINTIMGHAPRESQDIVAVGSSRFFSREEPSLRKGIVDAGALQVIKGFIQSVRPATGRLLLNVNVTHGIFRRDYKIPELFTKLRGSGPKKLQSLQKIVSKARVNYQILSTKKAKPCWKEVTAAGLARSTDTSNKQKQKIKFPPGEEFGYADKVEFLLGEPPKQSDGTAVRPAPGLEWGKRYTVSNYYWIKYKYRPQTHLPLVNVGTPTDPVYVPAELCQLVGFDRIKYKLDEQTTSEMIKFSVKAPPENADLILGTGLTAVLKHTPSNSLLRSFGLTVEPELITVRGRQLEPPQVTYRSAKGESEPKIMQVAVDRAGWTMRDRYDQGIGVIIPYQQADSMEVLKERIETKLRTLSRLDFALVILPDNGADIYTAVKVVGDIELGFHTVCVTKKNFLADQFAGPNGDANLAAKINLKLGGVNHAIQPVFGHCVARKTMFVGYDVVHPTGQAGNEEETNSQVGLVSSIDDHSGQWRACYWTQPGRQEILGEELTAKFESRLKLYKNNKKLPETILIYRDGVSEGQYLQVLERELPLIRNACQSVYGDEVAKPKITIVVSVKRHAARFFPTRAEEMDSSTYLDPSHKNFTSKNIKSGTVVDRGVTQARYWDFYLTAHCALKGTARPAHYVVLHDEIFANWHLKDLPEKASPKDVLEAGKKAVDDLEAITHHLCYVFGRATKAISICTPARYADIVCTRARLHASGLARLASRPGLSENEKNEILAKKVHGNLENTMYWI
ncbi:hypothetical protein INS49_009862 [Diaporthe citri]|uniref:uncharacterized protein n=1 Tax=Diaporthe citri TaxID=83186 RepID=UPI001C8064E3|nr:uncharacterized protein INS49_009862 [Diaporthe citri]KAG6361635.1 hypothetical protein INS49_009862 [Diaporthe citri]